MHVIVVGCGRVGSTIALHLSEAGHSVCVIDRRAEAFRRLGANFAGTTLVGVGFDRDVLTRAGITGECSVAAVTSGDNSNILIARVARETFGIDRVVARIYDPKRAVIYERLGISTVASVAWTSERVLQRLLPGTGADGWLDPSAKFAMVERRVGSGAAGTAVAAFEAASHGRITLLSRNGEATMPEPTTLLQQDDVIHVLGRVESVHDVDAAAAGHAADDSKGHH